ncbi:hypothetical protein B0T18DRAFT_385148 [Schizothecium vesticola]|uniref:Uncharacterized protein n=1 Tax=Schizothecium vesticola TaxID=314040 RepID=A0AA40F864_9PEZI|nr:hypothetical protein B0T18DRAFT_385148 [Schizothecium vesticola]
MHFHLPTLLAALGLATMAAAEHMYVDEYCATLLCNRNGRFVTNWGEYRVDAADGCRSVPNSPIREICVDERNERLHFYYTDGQPKRCMRVTSSEWQTCSDDFQWATCASEFWEEKPCDW